MLHVAQRQQNQTQNNHNFGQRGGRGHGRGGHDGHGRGCAGRGNKPTCQICFKYDHDAFNCWNRFDESYVQPDPPPEMNEAQSQQPVNLQQQSNVQNVQQPRAYIASQQGPYTPTIQEVQVPLNSDLQMWHPDSGASHHVTSDSHNFTQRIHYTCAEQVTIGNGQDLSITSIASSYLTSSSNPNITLSLHDLCQNSQKIMISSLSFTLLIVVSNHRALKRCSLKAP